MATKQTQLFWNPQDKRTLEDSSGNQIRNVSASDLLPMSLMGCSVHDVIEILVKQRQDLHEIKVTSEHTQDENPPWKFTKIHLHYQIFGKGIDLEKANKAIQLSEEKYCSVYATLRDSVDITHSVEVVEVE
jgi:putative redox protein